MAELRELGRTGIRVHPLCLGGNVLGGHADRAASFEVLDAYRELGGNHVDTAEAYSRWLPGHTGGESESMIGAWLKARPGARSELVIASKLGAPLTSGRIREQFDLARRRLGVDHVDIYYTHFWDGETALEETLEALDGLVRAGDVRFLGASNHTADQLTSALELQRRHGWAEYLVLQPGYSLLNRKDFEGALEDSCAREELGVCGYAALGGGFLTGKYQRDGALPDSRRAQAVKNRFFNDHAWKVLEAVLEAARESGSTPAQVALAWVMAKPGVTAAIAAGMSRAQVEELIAAADLLLDEHSMARLDAASAD